MSDTMNILLTESAKTPSHSTINTARAGLQGKGINASVNAEKDSATAEDSFEESMLKVIDETTTDKKTLNTEQGGNVSPIVDDLMATTAQADHQLAENSIVPEPGFSENNTKVLPGSAKLGHITEAILDTSLKISKSNLPTALPEQANSVASDNALNNDAKASLLFSPMRQLLQAESKLQTNKNQPISTTTVIATSDNVLSRQSEMPQVKLEGFDFFNQKNMVLAQQSGTSSTEFSSQLQTATDLQSALLSRSSVLSTDSSLNILSAPVMSSAATASGSAALLNLQVLPQVEISEQFGRSAWAQGMGKQITWLANQNIKSAEIRLNPAHLGPIEVKLEISDDQINVALSSRHAAVREAMEMALPKLREMLDSNGLNLSDTDISQHSFAEQREQNTANTTGNRFNGNSEHSEMPLTDVEVIQQTQLSTAMVDYYI